MFRFSIRELMLVTLVVGLVAGWLLDHGRQARAIESEKAWRLRAQTLEKEWRLRAGTLETIVVARGWKVLWREDQVGAFIPSEVAWDLVLSEDYNEPSPVSPVRGR